MENSQNFQTEKNFSPLMSKLILAWRNEKLTSNLLPYETEIIDNTILEIEKKEKELKNSSIDKDYKYFINLDISRIKFLIKDYIRIRLQKIEKYQLNIIYEKQVDILNSNEMKYCVDLLHYKANYINQNLKNLSALVNNFKIFEDKTKKIDFQISKINENMLIKPNEKEYVIIENISNENLIYNIRDIYENYEGEMPTMSKEERYLLPIGLVKKDVESNKAKII